MRILFTGKENFIFKGFSKAFRSKYTIDKAGLIDYNNLETVKETVKKKKYDAIVHVIYDGFARYSISREELMAFRNVQFAAIMYSVKKMLVISDASDLYPSQFMRNASETIADRVPLADKLTYSYLLNSWACQDGMCTLLRLFNVFGEDVKAKDLFNRIILGALLKKGIVQTDYDYILSAIYSGDVYKIISKFLDNDYAKGSYNLVSDERISLFDAAKKAIAAAKKCKIDYDVVFNSFEMGGEFTGSNYKLKSTVKDIKFTSLLSGITRMYEPRQSMENIDKPENSLESKAETDDEFEIENEDDFETESDTIESGKTE